MTESEWLASKDPAAMLRHLTHWHGVGPPRVVYPLASERILRLFACTSLRHLWQVLDPAGREAVALAERWADGEDVHADLYDLISHSGGIARVLHYADAGHVAASVVDSARHHNSTALPSYADLFRDIIGNPFRRYAWSAIHDASPSGHELQFLDERWRTETVLSLARAAYEERQRPCDVCDGAKAVLEHRAGEVRGSACPVCHDSGEIDDGSLDPDRLAILADALEEAGCICEEILRHLRGQERCFAHPTSDLSDYTGEWSTSGAMRGPKGPIRCQKCGRLGTEEPGWQPLRGGHIRGCWVVDLILGKE